jgi:hypothetical protein
MRRHNPARRFCEKLVLVTQDYRAQNYRGSRAERLLRIKGEDVIRRRQPRGLGCAMTAEYLKHGWNVVGTVRGEPRTPLHDLADKSLNRLTMKTAERINRDRQRRSERHHSFVACNWCSSGRRRKDQLHHDDVDPLTREALWGILSRTTSEFFKRSPPRNRTRASSEAVDPAGQRFPLRLHRFSGVMPALPGQNRGSPRCPQPLLTNPSCL